MRFKQLSTGAVLDVKNEAVIEMMKASDAYVVIAPAKAQSEEPKGEEDSGQKKAPGKDKKTGGGKSSG